MPRFKIGERVPGNGRLGELHGGEAHEKAASPGSQGGTDVVLLWYVLHIRRGFVPVTVEKLRQMNLEFIVPSNGGDAVLARLMPEQCASVSFLVGVRGIAE